MEDLSTKTLAQLVKIVDDTIESTLDCSRALREIRNRKLWIEESDSFQEFCENHWRISKTRAYQLIDYVEIIEKLPTNSSTMVDSERVVRELKKVPEKERAAVIEKAASTGKVTASAVANAARSMTVDATVEYYRTGFEIPQGSPAMATWLRCPEIQEMLTNLSRIKSAMERAKDAKEPMFAEVNYTNIISDLQSSYQLLKVAMPFAVCPTCQGRVLSECSTCRCRGMVSEFYWKYKVPDTTKAIREKAVNAMLEKKKGKK